MTIVFNYCIDCNKQICDVSYRCRKCAAKIRNPESMKNRRSYKGKKHPNYKEGRTLKKAYCIDCKKKLSKHAYYYKYQRCLSCSQRLKVMKQWGNEISRNILVSRIIKGLKLKQNQLESKLNLLLNNILPGEYKYVGDGEIIIGGFNPDFINCNGKKKIIELYGDYWHKTMKYLERDPRRIKAYKKYGYKTLIIWEKELKDIEKVKNRVLFFNTK